MLVVLNLETKEEVEKFLLSRNYDTVELGFGVVAEIDELKIEGEDAYIDFKDNDKNLVILSIGEAPCYEGSTCVEEPRLVYLVDVSNQDSVRELAEQIFRDL